MRTLAIATRVLWVLAFVAVAFGTVVAIRSGSIRIGGKYVWIAAVLFALAVRVGSLESLPAPMLLWYRNLSVIAAVLLFSVGLLLMVAQLPHERLPHYKGVIVGLSAASAAGSMPAVPRVSFADQDGSRTVDDALAPTRFPNRQFAVGEPVTVVIVPNGTARIETSWWARWDTAVLLTCATFIFLALAMVLNSAAHLGPPI